MWGKAKEGASATWSGVYKVADKVGFWANKQAAKVGIEAFYPTSLDVEVIKAARILRTFTLDAPVTEEPYLDRKKTQKVIRKIPPSAIDKCCGLAIFTVFRTGFVFSGAGGSGIVIAKLPDGSWSAPSGILLHTLGWGLLAGADIYDVVLILRTPAAVKAFAHPRVTVGGEATVTAGPVGNGAMLEAGMELSPVWSYVKSKGLYGGLQVDGNIIIERNDENARAYFRTGIKAKNILDGEVFPPVWCAPLHQTILAACGRQTATDKIPAGPSAGDMDLPPPRKLEKEDEDYEDQVARAEMEEHLMRSGIEDPKINLRRQSTDELMVLEDPSTSTSGLQASSSQLSTPPIGSVPASPTPPPRPPRRFVAPLPSQGSSPNPNGNMSLIPPVSESSTRSSSPRPPDSESVQASEGSVYQAETLDVEEHPAETEDVAMAH